MKFYISLLLLVFSLNSFATAQSLIDYDEKNIPVSNVQEHTEHTGAFSLSTIVDNFLSQADEQDFTDAEQFELQRSNFVDVVNKFNQGNVVVAYDEFEELLSGIQNDFARLVFAKSMYEIGFFSIGQKAIAQIKNKKLLKVQAKSINDAFLPAFVPDKNEEIYLAKAYSSIHFDNSAQETAYELHANAEMLKKSDYANYVLAQAMSHSRQFQQALLYIDKALELNQDNISYLNFKVTALIALNKNKEAYKLISKIMSNYENYIFINNILIQKQIALSNLSKEDADKKYYLVLKTYLQGNYEKVIEDCDNILSFDKNNYKILSLKAKAQFMTKDLDNAKKNYQASYDINKNYALTLEGLGDIKFVEYSKEEALKYYLKAYSKDKNNHTNLIKVAIIYRNDPKYSKEFLKVQKKLDKMNNKPFIAYYDIATSIAYNNKNLQKTLTRRSSTINPFYENNWVTFLNYELENDDLERARHYLYVLSYSNQANYYYHYINALYDIKTGDNQGAIVNLKNALSLKPDFEVANRKLIEMIPNKIEKKAPAL